MTDRIKLLIQKRTSLKSQITNSTNLLEKDRHGCYDKTALKLRMVRVTELYHAYEDYNDELLTLDSNENHKDEFANVQDRFYSLAARIGTLTDSIPLADDAQQHVSSSSVKKPRISNKAFAINMANMYCIACKNKQHPLYKCDKFKQLDAFKRIEIVRNARFCYNCSRSHKGKPCNYANCTICQKRYNTLLHLDNYPSITTKIDAADSKTDKTS
ncbi:hypothetical protein ALC62_02117 [Cyphomyrmex costatus]|uniref:Uncharacterized protein n=1 Tax=Cyphomyrmex costatus TaxID=456900 RepID=A0A195D1Y3_9HYME|nr:hypothetical protein ALC62_02117 [Cyphomyrmex costatus]